MVFRKHQVHCCGVRRAGYISPRLLHIAVNDIIPAKNRTLGLEVCRRRQSTSRCRGPVEVPQHVGHTIQASPLHAHHCERVDPLDSYAQRTRRRMRKRVPSRWRLSKVGVGVQEVVSSQLSNSNSSPVRSSLPLDPISSTSPSSTDGAHRQTESTHSSSLFP